MKKKDLFAISLLGLLVFVSFANVSVAAPPSYVGVKEGDQYIWRASFNPATVNATALALFGMENWTYMYEYFLEYFENITTMPFDFLTGAGMKIIIQNVTDEMPHPWMTGLVGSGLYFDYYIAYAEDNWTLINAATDYVDPMVILLNPSTLNESTIMYAFSGLPVFMPKGYNYGMFADFYQTLIDGSPQTAGNMTFQVQGNGFKITLKPPILEYMYTMMGAPFEVGTLVDAVFNVRWNSNGVFEYGDLVYGGITLATGLLVTSEDEGIPGFELVTIFGVSLATIIALVYIQRKKKILN